MAKDGIGDEFDLIAHYFAPLAAGAPGALGLTDDAAIVDIPDGMRLVAAADAMVAGIHFLADDPPGDIARKIVRVNLSDLAAKGDEGGSLSVPLMHDGYIEMKGRKVFTEAVRAMVTSLFEPGLAVFEEIL